MSWVFNAFIISYTTCEIPTGRAIVMGHARCSVVVWWSFFTALTGAATSLTMLLVVRFLFGAGEAGAFRNCGPCPKEWFPSRAGAAPRESSRPP